MTPDQHPAQQNEEVVPPMSRIPIRVFCPNGVTQGTKILLPDGKPLEGVSRLVVDIDACNTVALAHIQLVNVEIPEGTVLMSTLPSTIYRCLAHLSTEDLIHIRDEAQRRINERIGASLPQEPNDTPDDAAQNPEPPDTQGDS